MTQACNVCQIFASSYQAVTNQPYRSTEEGARDVKTNPQMQIALARVPSSGLRYPRTRRLGETHIVRVPRAQSSRSTSSRRLAVACGCTVLGQHVSEFSLNSNMYKEA